MDASFDSLEQIGPIEVGPVPRGGLCRWAKVAQLDLDRLPPAMKWECPRTTEQITVAAAKAKTDGVDVTLEVWPGMVHVFQSQTEPPLPEGQQALDRIAGFMRSHLPAYA